MQLKPTVLWFTGLSGAGKSTIADALYNRLARLRQPLERLDGDDIRHIFPQTGFSRHDRDLHLRRVGFLASRLEHHGVFVIASFITPYNETREAIRKLCRNYFEVYVSTSLQECERRDVKGLYAKARRGELKNFTGIDDPFEPPRCPDLTIDTERLSVDAAVDLILRQVKAET